ncbi:MAG TPA: alpha-amylase family protein [Gemmatimonadaceae bacterium]
MGISDLWYKNAIIYALDVKTFWDSDGDGVGDFAGLTTRLDYLERLGVTCLWILPFYPSPDRDNGYDITDYYAIDPRLGTLGDFVEFVHEAGGRGIRVLTDLVVNHTSNQHPWFQASRRDPSSRYRDYYVWSREKPEHPEQHPVFPGESRGVWSYDDVAEAYYFHHFYSFEPGLNLANPDVQQEIFRIMGFWLELGISGFRVDSAPFLVRPKGKALHLHDAGAHTLLERVHRFAQWRRSEAVMLAEANVEPDKIASYFGDGDEMQMLFNFFGDSHLFLAFATERAEYIARGLSRVPSPPLDVGQWVNYLRNLDELDLERLSREEQETVFETFAPEQNMRIFGRGIRRRLASMLGGDERRIQLAFSLIFTLPGTPLFVYGDEIGMGDDLALRGRDAVRTPMQWSGEPNGGFSRASASDLVRPVVSSGPFRYERINVGAQRRPPESLLNRVVGMIAARKECPEFGWGTYRVLDAGDAAVFAHRCDWSGGTVFALHNLSARACTVTVPLDGASDGEVSELMADHRYGPVGRDPFVAELGGYGFRWFRLGDVHRPAFP